MTSKNNTNEFLNMLNNFFPEGMTSGQIIKAKRQNFGITLEEVEEVTGISQSNLSMYENDKKRLGLVQATKIGIAIGLHPMTILFPNGIEGDTRFQEVIKRSAKLMAKKISVDKATG